MTKDQAQLLNDVRNYLLNEAWGAINNGTEPDVEKYFSGAWVIINLLGKYGYDPEDGVNPCRIDKKKVEEVLKDLYYSAKDSIEDSNKEEVATCVDCLTIYEVHSVAYSLDIDYTQW